MQTTYNSKREAELMLKIDYIRDLFIRNEDSMALQEFDSILQEFDRIVQEMPDTEQVEFRKILLQSLKCMEGKDYVRLTDILIFEIKPFLKTKRG